MTDPQPPSEPVLAGRYRIQGELGRGGMATVYLAVDEKHGRKVALKVFRQDLAAAVGAERFLREVQITAGLNHPHVLPLLDSGGDGGLLYYVMPFVAGDSLRRPLVGGEPIPLEAVLRIVREVASALDYAHAQGVVHRDIKPENVLFNEGLAVVGDFGVARAVSLAPRDHMTRTGVAVGTLGYMSPEQALGSGEVDARTDVFSLGCVAYEMLTGGTPAAWPLPDDVRLGRLTEVPAPHRARLDALPGRVEQVLARALALRPSDRFATAGEMAASLIAASERTPAFTEEQVRRLLDRAAEIQALEPLEEGALTIGAVEQVAAQVGIPPEHVRQAARELAVREPKGLIRTAGGQVLDPGGRALDRRGRPVPEGKWGHVVITRILEGEAPESAFPAIVEEIQDHVGILGHASVLAGSLTWSPATQSEDSRRLVVSIRAKDGATQVTVHEEFGAGGLRKMFFPAGAIAGALTGVGIGALVGLGPVLAIPGMAVGLTAAILGTVRVEARIRRPGLQDLADRLAQMVRDAVDKRLGPG